MGSKHNIQGNSKSVLKFVNVISILFLNACTAQTITMRSNSTNESAPDLPLISWITTATNIWKHHYLKIKDIDGIDTASAHVAYVYPGNHKISYSCSIESVNIDGNFTLEVKPGYMYFIEPDPSFRYKEVITPTSEPETNITIVDRTGKTEYQANLQSRFLKTEQKDVNCSAKITECQGFFYSSASTGRHASEPSDFGRTCLKKPLGAAESFFSNSKELRPLFK